MDCVLVEGKQDSAGAHIIDLPGAHVINITEPVFSVHGTVGRSFIMFLFLAST